MGNIEAVRVMDRDGNLVRTLSRQFDELGRLLKSLGAPPPLRRQSTATIRTTISN